uniref:Disease resistance protein RPM1 n=1 Tax=Aegilops tauschii TaxID=37682 RepID=M8D265_AEGTA
MEMVVGASEATMKSLLSKLGGLLAHEYALIRGVRGDIQYINDEMASMQAFLGDLSSAAPQGHDRRMRDWMKQIRDVTYDIEDCVDDFAHRLSHDPAAGRDVWCVFLSSTAYEIWTWRPRRSIASSIAELKVRAQQIGERRTRYGVENPRTLEGESGGALPKFETAEYQHTTLALVGTKKPVGVEEEMKELGRWLTLQQPSAHDASSSSDPASQTEALKQDQAVLSIVGFGGVGKTTIATALYQEYSDQFDRRATVTVSQSSDIDMILLTILSQVKPQSKDDNEQQGSSGGGPSDKKCLMATIGIVWGTIMHKGRKDDKQRGGGTSQTTKDLKQHLEEHLVKNSYLLLVDDVWSAPMWKKIKNLLPKSNKGSRIIVTTRFQAVANECRRDKGDHIHKVVVLSDNKPKELFMAESGISVDKPKENQEKIPARLWEMCGGLPLAIVTMAGYAACNPDKLVDKWDEVCSTLVPDSGKALGQDGVTRILSHCYNDMPGPQGQQGYAACNPDKLVDKWDEVCSTLVPDSGKALGQDGVTRILSHCYNDMPGEIKTCSLYLCIFPKGRKVSGRRLTRRWLAERFVSEKDGLSAEDVAEAYFNHLVRRKIIRAVEHSSNGKVKSYQVHDMVLEYIVSKASEENFVTVVGGHWLMAPPSNKVRRLSLQVSDTKHKKSMESMNLTHVRSLTMFGSLTQLPSNSLKFGIVQVLDLEGCKDFRQHHAEEICKMLLLKHLSLRRTDIDKIPKKIGKLQYLETLDIRETNVTELPNTICLLERVENILGGNKRTRKALKLPEDLKKETMKSLRILSGIEIVEGPGTVADFHHLTDLRKLTIYRLNLEKGSELFGELSSSIEYLGGYSLHTLVIDDESSEFLISLGALSSPPKFLNALELSGKLVELPKWITELDALTKLTLSVTVLTADALHVLSKLNTLFSLTFSLTAAKQDPETIFIIEENKRRSDGQIMVPTAKQDPETIFIIEENKRRSDGQIMVPTGGFENLKLLRFLAPFVPLLSFPKNSLPKLERLELRFSMFEGLYGLENLAELEEVHLRVHDKADETTKSFVEGMATAAREGNKCHRIIVDQYHGRETALPKIPRNFAWTQIFCCLQQQQQQQQQSLSVPNKFGVA